jgi:hypothetical protein
LVRLACCILILDTLLWGAEQPGAADISSALAKMSIDPEQTYHVRDLELTRGDIKVYLTEGVLSFATPVDGRRVAAVFTIEGVEGGDGEVLLMPSRASERASLTSFAKTPNIDEHIASALLVFSDGTGDELLQRIQQHPVRPAQELISALEKTANPILTAVASAVDVKLVHALLDSHKTEDGFFYSFLLGRQLGEFDLLYDPTDFEPVAAGRSDISKDGIAGFNIWTSFRPRHAPPYVLPSPRVSDYQIDAAIDRDLSMKVTAGFTFQADAATGRVISMQLSRHLRVDSATVDGRPAEVFQHSQSSTVVDKHPDTFLVVSPVSLSTGSSHHLQLTYRGSVIRQTQRGEYFVDDRNAWYPFVQPTLASFDLTFHCPKELDLVATGEPVSNEVSGQQRTVHRRTRVPVALAGFNLGDYVRTAMKQGDYRVECYAERLASTEVGADLLTETARILEFYTLKWILLPIRTVALTPIAGYFGQGFPGLIYLSEISYTRPEDRPRALRNPELDSFFSELLLPHEIAHQWWGNVVRSANYRSAWLTEAMANYSALQFLENENGADARDKLLATFRADLMQKDKGQTIESAGPIDFGERLIEPNSFRRWHAIIYEKGAWTLHMLHERMGDERFRKMQLRLLDEYASKPITNDELQTIASSFIPADQPDRSLDLFFETWVYSTGIPSLKLEGSGSHLSLKVSGVDEDFTADVPLSCLSSRGKETTHWLRATFGSNPVDLPAGISSCALPSPSKFLFIP